MINKLKGPAVFILIFAVLLGMISSSIGVNADDAAVAAYKKKLKAAQELKAEYEQSKQKAEELKAQFSQEKADVEAYIEELDLQMNDISLRLFELKEEISSTEAELEQTVIDLENAKKIEADQYATMKKRVQYIYENGETSYLDVLMNASSLGDLLNQLEYVSSIQRYDNSLLDRYEQARKDVEDREAYLEASLEELQALERQAQIEQSTIEDLVAMKNAEIESITEQLGVADEYLFTYLTEISKQEKEIAKIIEDEEKRVAEEERKRKEEEARLARERAAAAAAAANKGNGSYNPNAIKDIVLADVTDLDSMIWPLPGDHRTYSKFGYRKAPTKGASTYHQGWDIGGEFGAPIVSVLAGTVYAVGYNASAGNYVKVEHQPGFISVYCHCSKTLVQKGEYIKQGTIVGLVGSTGVSTAPHLHFSISVNGAYVDPNPYIGKLE